MTTRGEAIFVDTNVWVYAGVDTAPKYEEAQVWLKQTFERDTTLCIG